VSSEAVPGEPLADPPSPKYQRAVVTLELGVPETWTDDGGKDRLIAEIERIMHVTGSGSGPGNATMHGLFVISYRPGSPDAKAIEEKLDLMRIAYPLRPRQRFDEQRSNFVRLDQTPVYEPVINPLATTPEEDVPLTQDPLPPGTKRLMLYHNPHFQEPPGYPSRWLDWEDEPDEWEYRGGCHE
jgi:hypothetical protein